MAISTFSFPTTIRFGSGASRLVGDHLKASGCRRPLVVTDRVLADLPLYPEILGLLQQSELDVGGFTDVWGNPTRSQVESAAAAYRDHDADCVVGLGGGAALDVAKALLVQVTHAGSLFDYEDVPGASPIVEPLPHFVAIPTTAGTGSEVGRSAVISDDDTHVKKIIFSPALLAKEVFADPDLTVGLPPHITAATGMDALTHNIEAYLAKDWHPMCDGIALEGVRLCSNFLERATIDGSDLEARSGMLMASMMGAVAFQKGLGLVHSCAHALGTAADVHHGLANAIMIDHALPFNVECSTDRFVHLATTVGVEPVPSAFLGWLTEMKLRLGIPAGLGASTVDATALGTLVDIATADLCHENNPRQVTATDFEIIFKSAFAAAQ